VYAQAALPADVRPAGWDFVFLTGLIQGAIGPEVFFQPVADAQTVRLAIEKESESRYFRENLRTLSHVPGLRLQVIARVNLLEPWIVAPLAVANDSVKVRANDEPRLELRESWSGRSYLGCDEIQCSFLRNARASAVVLDVHSLQPEEIPSGHFGGAG
jgi:hypothetical protein